MMRPVFDSASAVYSCFACQILQVKYFLEQNQALTQQSVLFLLWFSALNLLMLNVIKVVKYMSLIARNPVFGVCNQVALKSICSASEAG